MSEEQGGEDNATLVARLFDEYAPAIFAYLWRLVGERGAAEDLTQETFARVFAARERLPEVVNRRAWVYRIATNTCFRVLRRRNRFAWLPWNAASGYDPRDPAEEAGQRDAVSSALAALTPQHRAPLLLYLHYGLSISEVAAALGISEGAVKTRIYRAREMFRKAYEREMAR